MGSGAARGAVILVLLAARPAAGAPLPPPEPGPARPAAVLPVPLPPRRPADLRSGPEPAQPVTRPQTPVTTATPTAVPPPAPPEGLALADAQACLRLFRDPRVQARLLPAIAPAGPGCGIASPAEIASIGLGPGEGAVRLEPPVTVGCAMGSALAAWVREDLAPAFAATGSPLAALTGSSGYACRARDGLAGAKPSEHGLGRAVDIGGFRRADGTATAVRQPDAAILDVVRASACARFATVLGPGSDTFHATHLHVDIEERRNRVAICQWDRS